MVHMIDASFEIYDSYENDIFSLQKWNDYMDRTIPYVKDKVLSDMQQSISPEYSWEAYYLPVLNAVIHEPENVRETAKIFRNITDGLEKKIIKKFGRTLDIDIILYLGLCNGAGWVTEIDGKTVILLGIEKILELKWNNIDDMTGLILHELGHAYQEKYGVLYRQYQASSDQFLWQLFTEGIAMVFEQEILNDSGYYHQNKDGWKEWCNQNISRISVDFELDYQKMTRENQRYFGDWARYEDRPDVGYYLGTRFVRFILEKEEFDRIICYEIEDVKPAFYEFMRSIR
jgi:hypothetical protein